MRHFLKAEDSDVSDHEPLDEFDEDLDEGDEAAPPTGDDTVENIQESTRLKMIEEWIKG